MITSIVLTGTYSIGVDQFGKFFANNIKVSVKDVPFVRYRFENYTDKELSYIREMKEKFKYSSHMAEIMLSNKTPSEIDALDDIPNVIRYIYVTVTDVEVTAGFSVEQIEMLKSLGDRFYDRLMIKDKSTTLDVVASFKLKKALSDITGMSVDEIGVCSSPLSFNQGNACIDALRAKQLSAEYAESDEVALPSANHECMNCCGCIRYCVLSADVAAPEGKKSNSAVKDTSNESKGEVKKPKAKRFKCFRPW